MADCDNSDDSHRDDDRARSKIAVEPLDTTQLPVLLSPTGVAALAVSREVYSRKAVLAAAYKLSDRCAVLVDKAEDGRWLLYVVATTAGDPGPYVEALIRELVDQALREVLEAEFGAVRTLIVAQAFSEGDLLSSHDNEGPARTVGGVAQDR